MCGSGRRCVWGGKERKRECRRIISNHKKKKRSNYRYSVAIPPLPVIDKAQETLDLFVSSIY